MKSGPTNALVSSDDLEKRNRAEAEFLEFISECLERGWCPTKCEKNCVVEPDGICPHGFKSVALELGLL